MDPLSLTASLAAVITITTQICAIISEIRHELGALPGRIHALGNEAEDLRIVLYELTRLLDEREDSGLNGNVESEIRGLLSQGRQRLLALKEVLSRIHKTNPKKREAIFRTLSWRKNQEAIAHLQYDIQRLKSNLNVLVGASNSRDMLRIRLDLEKITTVSGEKNRDSDTDIGASELMGKLLLQHQTSFSQSMDRHHHHVEERLSRVEALLQMQTSKMHGNQISQFGPLHDASPPSYRKRPTLPLSPSSDKIMRSRAEAVGFRLRQRQLTCRPTCSCACHDRQRSATPSVLKQTLGQLFVGYAGLPVFGSKCDSLACEKGRIPSISVEYWFPLGFCWSQIIRLQLAYQANIGPSLQLSTLRCIPDSAESVSFALNGNVEGLKSLFAQGLASPRDVSSTRGYSLLRWALYGQQYETCKFLMTAGADPTYRPIALSDDCPADKCCDVILRGGLPREVMDILRIIAEGSDFIESQNFSSSHKIVLGLSMGDLQQDLQHNPYDVDVRDATGRTPLQWAAARGDDTAVVTLLGFGADPNNMDKKLNTPLTLAANQNHTVCVRLLLEAGALPDPILPRGVKFGTPLNCAARNARDPMLLKTLLDFNANIEACGVDGFTSLLHVARGNSATHAMLLLEYGADINAQSVSSQTPLTVAIQYNNSTVLKLLLDRWSEYNECPRLKGPHLLQIVAQYATAGTMQILAAAEHLRARSDDSYLMAQYTQLIDKRLDASPKLRAAFDDLVSVLRNDAASSRTVEHCMEAGLLNRFEILCCADDESDSGSLDFEDAQEYLPPSRETAPSSCPIAMIEKRATM